MPQVQLLSILISLVLKVVPAGETAECNQSSPKPIRSRIGAGGGRSFTQGDNILKRVEAWRREGTTRPLCFSRPHLAARRCAPRHTTKEARKGSWEGGGKMRLRVMLAAASTRFTEEREGGNTALHCLRPYLNDFCNIWGSFNASPSCPCHGHATYQKHCLLLGHPPSAISACACVN